MVHTGHGFKIYKNKTHILVAFGIIALPVIFIFLAGQLTEIPAYSLLAGIGLSLYRLALAYLISLIIGVFLAVLLGQGKIGDFFVPVFDILQNLPSFALIPVFVLLFGYTNKMAIIFAASSILWPILFYVLNAIKTAKLDFNEAATVFGATGIKRIFHYFIPLSFPAIITGSMVGIAIGWEAVNMFFAPFLTELSYKEIKQIAQMLVWEFSELAGARGSQLVFSDLNLYYGIPKHFRESPALGPGGKYITKGINEEFVYHNEPVEGCLKYKDFERESNLFLKALFEIYLAGDAKGRTFYFPKPLLHINEEGMKSGGWEDFFTLACKVAGKMGITYFVFDRGDSTTISQCCRLKLKLNEVDLEEAVTPEKMRFSALQNVTINLPRIAFKAKGDIQALFAELDRMMELVVKAHQQKLDFVKSLLSLGPDGPLALFLKDEDGRPYLKLDRLTFLAGLFGLNELVQYHTGKQLHESEEAFKFGLQVISRMKLKCEELHKKYGIKLVLEESPAESSGYRLAKLDLKYFPEEARKVVKGNAETGYYYYTNSVHFAYDAPMDYIDRVKMQSKFHPLIEAGSIIHIWLGESEPSPESIKNFVLKTFYQTTAEQIAFSPEFTFCTDCHKTVRGLHDKCTLCGSENIDSMTRIVGYFSNISGWNKGKVAELGDRVRTSLGGINHESEAVLEPHLSAVPGC